MSKITLHSSETRGHANHGWLDAHHSFSFASWYNQERIHFGVLRVLNDDHIKAGYGFGKHPHDNMEIITIILEGTLEHQDSMGHTETIKPNEVQVMSAGSGVVHSEYNHSKEEDVRLFQIWIFPNKQNVSPRYDQKIFSPSERINQLQTIVSPIDNEDEGLKIHQNAWIYRTQLEENKTIELQPHSEHHGFYIMLIDGSATIENNNLSKRDAIGISETKEVKINTEKGCDLLILEVPMYIN